MEQSAKRRDSIAPSLGQHHAVNVPWRLAMVAALSFAAYRAQARTKKAIQLIAGEADAKSMALRVKRLQTVTPDHYGTEDCSKWNSEKIYFINTRILPLLRSHKLEDRHAKLNARIHVMIEATARSEAPPGAGGGFVRSPESFDPKMDPLDYKRFCARQLEKAGWSTRLTAATGDQGADIIATRNETSLVVQCKLYSSLVGNDAVQQVIGARSFSIRRSSCRCVEPAVYKIRPGTRQYERRSSASPRAANVVCGLGNNYRTCPRLRRVRSLSRFRPLLNSCLTMRCHTPH